MSASEHLPKQNKFTLAFIDDDLEREFKQSYDKSVRLPLRYGIIISLLSWYSSLFLIYSIIPEEAYWLTPLTLIYIGSYFGFIVYATFNSRFEGYYHLMGAISNAWAGLYAIYFCDQFPNGESLTLPVLIFIIFFGSYMVRLRWIGGFTAALSYTVGYHVYIAIYSDLTGAQVILFAFVAWMTLIFAILAGRVAESNNRIAFVQRRTIREQSAIIEQEKEMLLKEVHHQVKNNLQIIVSLINLQLAKFDHEEVNAALKETQSRVMSMSLVHQKMHQTSNFSEIELSGYIRQLIDHSKQIYGQHDIRSDINIPKDVRLDIESAIPIGLMVNEILSNCFKHCVLENKQRAFSIDYEQKDGGICVLKYKDNGPGFPEGISLDDANALGLELIDSLTQQLEGTFNFFSDKGAVYTLSLKLA